MKKNLLAIVLFFPLLFSSVSCNNKENDTVCTMEFRYVTITVNGGMLDDYFTIRESTGDTIRFEKDSIIGQNVYIVLDDTYQPMIENKTENFRFKGVINDTVAVNELFRISADKCHIEYVSGALVVNL
jgi:hypothetical protein